MLTLTPIRTYPAGSQPTTAPPPSGDPSPPPNYTSGGAASPYQQPSSGTYATGYQTAPSSPPSGGTRPAPVVAQDPGTTSSPTPPPQNGGTATTTTTTAPVSTGVVQVNQTSSDAPLAPSTGPSSSGPGSDGGLLPTGVPIPPAITMPVVAPPPKRKTGWLVAGGIVGGVALALLLGK